MTTFIERARQLEAEGVFLGGPAKFFEVAGQKLLITLLSEGLTPYSKVLDIGCGCLRGGYWLIHFLGKRCYYGIEPNSEMLEAGIHVLLEPTEKDLKEPRFDNNANFDFAVFKEKFDFFVARSIWTHASREDIQVMLNEFVKTANSDGIFLTSYIKTNIFEKGYMGKNWVGKSHESSTSGIVRHSFSWIQEECTKRGLIAHEIKDMTYNFGNQTWVTIKRKTI